jgi:polyisoprenyl-teichoic acid--peptidoglycan teichoic acid transferase
MKTRSQPVSSVSFVPPVINTADPDIDKIHRMVQSAIDRSEGKATASAAAKPKKAKGFSRAGSSTVGGSIGSYSEGYAANASRDLSSAC